MISNMDGRHLFDLSGRIAILTGATGHFGRVFARALCDAGAEVLLVARNSEVLNAMQAELITLGHKATVFPTDLRDDQSVQDFCHEVARRYDRVDILINNAYSGNGGTVDTSTPDAFNTAYHLTVIAAFRLVQLLRPLLSQAARENRCSASVVNIASMYGVVSPDPGIYLDINSNNPPYYGAAKSALIQLGRYLACHLAESRIRVNSISPGPFPPFEIAEKTPQFYLELRRKTPMGRIGRPEELVGAVLFLASDASSYVTGINLPVDGGWTAW